MQVRYVTAFVVATLTIISLCSNADAEKRAFIVGIQEYKNFPRWKQLAKAGKDGDVVAKAFADLGFLVTPLSNLTKSEFSQNFESFVQSINEGDEVVFFFSGHGFSSEDTSNYLLPSDAPSTDRSVGMFVKDHSISLNSLIAESGRRKPKIRIFIIDACRNNPYNIDGKGSEDSSRLGLKPPKDVRGTFIMFSASEGQTAVESISENDSDPNSPYTRVLNKYLHKQGLTVSDLARRVRDEVQELVIKKPHDQIPAYYDSFNGEYCLTAKCKSNEELVTEAERLSKDAGEKSEELKKLREELQKLLKRTDDVEKDVGALNRNAKQAEEDLKTRTGVLAAKPPTESVVRRRNDLAKLMQDELIRLNCYRGENDGVWGSLSREALQSFSEFTKFDLPSDDPSETSLAVLKNTTSGSCKKPATVDAAVVQVRPRPKDLPSKSRDLPDANEYSKGVWKPYTIEKGQTVSTTTPYGRLICVGGGFSGQARECRWK